MDKPTETLGQYIERITRQKNLSSKDVARRCGITNSYISRVIKGQGGNLTVDTIVKLAAGLEVDPHELFTAASGKPQASQASTLDPLLMIDMIQKLMLDPKEMQLLQDWLKLSPKSQETVIDFVKRLNERQQKRERDKDKPRRK